MSGSSRSRGFTVLELMVTLMLTILLGSVLLRAFVALHAGVGRIIERSAAAEAVRVAHGVLRSELEVGAPGIDWSPSAPDSVRVRAFRGVAEACAAGPDSSVVVVRRGGRIPDPGKDSVLVLVGGGAWRQTELVRRTAGGSCALPMGPALGLGGEIESWRLRPAVAAPVLLTYFESGSYHLADGALRYRRGGGGRQPITEALFRAARLIVQSGVLRAELESDGVPPVSAPIVPTR